MILKNENYALVYWNSDLEGPIFHFLNENVENIKDFAEVVVPKGTYYNIIEKTDIHDMVPPKTEKLLPNSISNLYFEYLKNL